METARNAQYHEHLQWFFDNETDYALVITDPQLRITEWIGGAESITGWRTDEVVGKNMGLLFAAGKPGEDAIANEASHAIRHGRADDNRWQPRKDGTMFYASGVMTSLWSDSGCLLGFGKVLRDSTKLKLATDRLREVERRKDAFIATLAHELRTPLTTIRGGNQLLALSSDPVAAEVCPMIERQVAHMIRLIEDVLDIARIRQDKLQLRRAVVSLQTVLESAVEMVSPLMRTAGHSLSVDLPAQPAYLCADASRLLQVFANLLSNSARYTPRGGHVWMTFTCAGGMAHVTVSDDGVGIAPEALAGVFDLYSQSGNASGRCGGGLGIGLALVRGLVRVHGGKVTAESAGEGRGSRFTVSLPTVAAAHFRECVDFHPRGSPSSRLAEVGL